MSEKLTEEQIRLKAIAKANNAVTVAALELQSAKEAHSAAKALYDGAVKRLREVCAGQDDNALFEGKEQAEAWRTVAIEELGLADGIVESLKAEALNTLGAIATYTAADKRLTDIKGIGEGKAAKIDEAMQRWFADHPQPSEDPVPTSDGDEAEEQEGAEA